MRSNSPKKEAPLKFMPRFNAILSFLASETAALESRQKTSSNSLNRSSRQSRQSTAETEETDLGLRFAAGSFYRKTARSGLKAKWEEELHSFSQLHSIPSKKSSLSACYSQPKISSRKNLANSSPSFLGQSEQVSLKTCGKRT